MPLPLKTDGYFAFVPLPPAGMERILPASRAKSGYRIALRILVRLPVAFQNDFLCNTITSLIFAASCICCKRQVREACPERRPRCDFLLRGGQNHPQPGRAGAKRRKSQGCAPSQFASKTFIYAWQKGRALRCISPKILRGGQQNQISFCRKRIFAQHNLQPTFSPKTQANCGRRRRLKTGASWVSSVTKPKAMPSKLLLNSTLEASSARTIPTPGQSRARGAPAPGCWPASSRLLTC